MTDTRREAVEAAIRGAVLHEGAARACGFDTVGEVLSDEVISNITDAVLPVWGGGGELREAVDRLRQAVAVPIPDEDHDLTPERARRGAMGWQKVGAAVVQAFDAALQSVPPDGWRVTELINKWSVLVADEPDSEAFTTTVGSIKSIIAAFSSPSGEMPVLLAELLGALKGVVAVADRKTDEFDRARAAIARAEGCAAPAEGWRLVPVELQGSMQGAGELAYLKRKGHASHLAVPAIWKAILEAAPKSPAEGGGE